MRALFQSACCCPSTSAFAASKPAVTALLQHPADNPPEIEATNGRGQSVAQLAAKAMDKQDVQSYRREAAEQEWERQGEPQRERSPSLQPDGWDWQVGCCVSQGGWMEGWLGACIPRSCRVLPDGGPGRWAVAFLGPIVGCSTGRAAVTYCAFAASPVLCYVQCRACSWSARGAQGWPGLSVLGPALCSRRVWHPTLQTSRLHPCFHLCPFFVLPCSAQQRLQNEMSIGQSEDDPWGA